MEDSRSDIPWVRLLAEAGAIVVSILVALGADAAWENHKDQVQEGEELARLSDELRGDLEFFHSDLLLQERILRGTTAVMAQLEGAAPGAEVEIPDSLGLMLLLAPTWDRPSNVLDALIGSGRLRLLSDPAVRDAISEWSTSFLNTREDQARAREFYVQDMLPFLRTSGDMTGLLEIRSALSPSSLRTNESIDWGEVRVSATRFRNSQELQNLVAEKRLWTRGTLRASESSVDVLEGLLDRVGGS